eukprot:Skav218527  [mRNA]  locus=scaffold2478:290773:293151:- [translate_table: standard]
MRAVFSVLVAAGNLKRHLARRRTSNVQKWLVANGWLKSSPPTVDMQWHLKAEHCQPHPYFIEKIIQFYECHIVRHSVMLVGMPFSGKTTALNCLQKTLTDLAHEGIMHAGCAVHQAGIVGVASHEFGGKSGYYGDLWGIVNQ